MRRFFRLFVAILLFLTCCCNADDHIKKLPRLRVEAPINLAVEEIPIIIEDEKMIFINSLIKQVWSEDFGKFTELFYRHHFSSDVQKRGLETFSVTEDTVLTVEKLMRYLYGASTESCLGFFRCWIVFYKNFHCNPLRKKIILESFKEFVCRFLIEISKNFYMTNELLKKKTEVMCELYSL